PKGILTHWFPTVRHFGPNPSARPAATPASSFLDWRTVHVIPTTQPLPRETPTAVVGTKSGPVPTHKQQRPNSTAPLLAVKAVGPQDSWRFARETDSAPLRVRTWNENGDRQDQLEKFVFYRGLGSFPLPLEVRTKEGCKDPELLVTVTNRGAQ